MSIKKLIAYITVIAILALSCNITVLAAEKPTAVVGATVCSGTTMTGSYTYTGSQSQGESIFRWYVSDDFFDKGTLVEGANELTFNVNKSTVGKFITFAVVPVDSKGTEGDEVCADPIMQNQGYYEDFASGMPENVTSVVTADGHVQIADDPAGGADKVLSVMKEHDSSYKTEARIKFDSVTASRSIVDVYLYASGIEGLARIFGVYNDTYGSVFELMTDSQGKLYYRGGNGMQESSLTFPADTWNHVTLEISDTEKTVKAALNGSNIINGSDTESWRFMNDGYDNVAVYFQNYSNGGNVYVKNLSVMNVVGQEAAEADAAALEDSVPYETIISITLPSSGANGSSIFWRSDKPQYITNDGEVTRPAYGDGDAEVVLTAYVINGSSLVKKEIIVTVTESTLPPVAEDITITQNASRYVIASYTFYDEDNDDESGSVYQWYVEENGEYKPVENANELIFVPSKDFDGKNIRFSVIPRNASSVVGVETFSEPFRYVYYETQKPVAQITDKKVNTDGAFEFKYSYTSADYIDEGNTVITWYMSDTLFGEYLPVSGAADTVFKPEKLDAYYKFSLTPVDAEGNMGDEVVVGPFMYAPSGTNGSSVATAAIASLILPEETMLDLELPLTTEDGAYYTWISSDESVITADGKITRPSKDGENVTVTLTVYAVCGFEMKSSEFTVIVDKMTEAPAVSGQKLYQVSRPIELEYEFADADGNAEAETKYEWYYKPDADSEFVLIEGAADNRYAPSKDMDGYIFIAKITPMDDTYTIGEQVITPEYTYVYQTPAKPTVQMNKTIYDATALIGDYVYENTDGIPEGESEYTWYVADKLFGNYKQIYGETGKSFAYDGSYNGKYIKFTVIPKDAEGIAGDVAEANPVLISLNAAETFEKDFNIAANINTSSLSGGTVEIAQDPADPTNTALKLQRTSTTNGEMTRIGYIVPQYSNATGMIIEADLYASSDISGTWEMFYICDTNTSQAYKLWHSGKSGLYSRGGSYTKPDGTVVSDSTMLVSSGFTKDTWHHVKIVLDTSAQMMVECSFNGDVVQTNMPFRYSVPVVGEILSYLQNSFTGTGYIDNIQITPVLDYTGMAMEDAAAIDLGADLDAVISNLRLPVKGSVNGSAITWTSSDESVITSRGKVNRPSSEEGDKQVTLTAHVITGNDYYTKEFNINVMRILTDEEIVEYDAKKLTAYDGMITDKDLSLVSNGIYGATYTWVSSDETVITNDGKVTQQDEKKDVTLNVTVSCGDFSETKQVTVTVAPVLSDNLIINGGIDSSSAKAQYPALNAGDGDYTTSWSSLNVDTAPAVILDMGKTKNVNQLYIADGAKSIKSLKITASRDKAAWSDVNITSSSMGSNINIVEFDKVSTRYIRVSFTSDDVVSANEIRLMYEPIDSDKVASGINDITLPVSESVTSDFEVITELADGTKVVWTSSDTDVISFNGSTAEVDRPSSDKSVTLTATVTSGGVSAEKVFVVLVEGKSSSSSGGGGGGGGGSSSGGRTNGGVTSAAGSAAIVAAPAVQSSTFADIASVPWAVEAINRLASIGVVKGTSEATFEPGRSITREEFAAILYRGFGFDKVAVNGSFSDVNTSDWYYEPVMQLTCLGIINGVGDGSFGTGRTITRQDMAVMIYRAAATANAQFTAGGVSFADSDGIAGYAKTAVDALSGAQIINGVGNDMFNPMGNATRAEATVILSRIMNYIK